MFKENSIALSIILFAPFVNVAILRYIASMDVEVHESDANVTLNLKGWHTDFYEKRDGRWQVVWSQMTQIQQI